jgi:hypothetical protein
MQKTPAFQWCCREERSTPEKCAGHIAEFERTLLLNHTVKARARTRPFIVSEDRPSCRKHLIFSGVVERRGRLLKSVQDT